jgi:integrase
MSRRRVKGNGDGSVFERKDRPGVYYAQVSFEGKRKTSVAQKTRKKANDWVREMLAAKGRGETVTGKSQTLAAYLQEWLKSAKPNLRPATHRGYEQLIRIHLIPKLGHHKLERLTPSAIQSLQNQMRDAGKAPRTIRYARAVLRKALKQAVNWGVLARNPVTLVEGPRVERFKIQPLDLEQSRQLLDAVRGDRHEALYTVALSLGLRQGEALGLQWQNIDLERGLLRVENQLQRVDHKLVLVPCKSDRSRRELALPAFTLAVLRGHRERQTRLLGAVPGPGSYVFTSAAGTPMDARNVVRHFKAILDLAGLPASIRFHDLRHSAATLLIAQGVHPRTIMEILGHSQIATTMNTYGHVLPATMQDAAERMDSLFTQAR